MAQYTFRCRKCGQAVTVEHPITDAHPRTHKGCGGKLVRVFDCPPTPIYKGAGFYTTEKRLSTPEDDLE